MRCYICNYCPSTSGGHTHLNVLPDGKELCDLCYGVSNQTLIEYGMENRNTDQHPWKTPIPRGTTVQEWMAQQQAKEDDEDTPPLS